MSSKINISHIVRQHFNTMIDASTGKVSIKDLWSFLIFPILAALFVIFYTPGLTRELLSLAVNFGAISTALLMSVLVLVYDQEAKIDTRVNDFPSKKDVFDIKLEVLRELYQNICYTIVVSILLVVFSAIGVALIVDCASGVIVLALKFISGFVLFFFINVVLTMLMIIKRFHALLTH